MIYKCQKCGMKSLSVITICFRCEAYNAGRLKNDRLAPRQVISGKVEVTQSPLTSGHLAAHKAI